MCMVGGEERGGGERSVISLTTAPHTRQRQSEGAEFGRDTVHDNSETFSFRKP